MSECKHRRKDGVCLQDLEYVYKGYCVDAPCSCYEPQTNADRIRGMSDYDLAKWIANILTCHGAMSSSENFDFDRYCIDCPLNKCCNDQPSDNIEDWLKAPVDKEGEG